jgi:hypothetical protein
MSGDSDPRDTDGCINAEDCWNVNHNNPVRVCARRACGSYFESAAHKKFRGENSE